jgi:hypothetical protein
MKMTTKAEQHTLPPITLEEVEATTGDDLLLEFWRDGALLDFAPATVDPTPCPEAPGLSPLAIDQIVARETRSLDEGLATLLAPVAQRQPRSIRRSKVRRRLNLIQRLLVMLATVALVFCQQGPAITSVIADTTQAVAQASAGDDHQVGPAHPSALNQGQTALPIGPQVNHPATGPVSGPVVGHQAVSLPTPSVGGLTVSAAQAAPVAQTAPALVTAPATQATPASASTPGAAPAEDASAAPAPGPSEGTAPVPNPADVPVAQGPVDPPVNGTPPTATEPPAQTPVVTPPVKHDPPAAKPPVQQDPPKVTPPPAKPPVATKPTPPADTTDHGPAMQDPAHGDAAHGEVGHNQATPAVSQTDLHLDNNVNVVVSDG